MVLGVGRGGYAYKSKENQAVLSQNLKDSSLLNQKSKKSGLALFRCLENSAGGCLQDQRRSFLANVSPQTIHPVFKHTKKVTLSVGRRHLIWWKKKTKGLVRKVGLLMFVELGCPEDNRGLDVLFLIKFANWKRNLSFQNIVNGACRRQNPHSLGLACRYEVLSA